MVHITVTGLGVMIQIINNLSAYKDMRVSSKEELENVTQVMKLTFFTSLQSFNVYNKSNGITSPFTFVIRDSTYIVKIRDKLKALIIEQWTI